MTTTAAPTFRRRPLYSLSRAEFLQFRRNKTLVVTGVVFPLLMPLAVFFLTRGDGVTRAAVAATFDMFALFTLIFVQYYSVLSMVLKRLRTGETPDWQILAAPNAPGIVVTATSTVLISVVVFAFGGPAPTNPILMIAGLVGGIVVFGLLALATTGFTKNAEAAQITSMPVMALAMIGMDGIRSSLGDRASEILGWTPFAAVSDLIHAGAAGDGFADAFVDSARPVATLVLWTALAIGLVYKSFRWDDRE